jgi:Tol biopolymer transport system component/DNA-binding winged helix-turn-helix (wHTH) protein
MTAAKLPSGRVYRFDDVLVDGENFRIEKNGEPRLLGPRAFDLLIYLIAQRGRVIDKQELFEQVWKDAFVTDNALTKAVKEIRRAIGDDADAPRYVETVPKRGYRFIAEVQTAAATPPEAESPASDPPIAAPADSATHFTSPATVSPPHEVVKAGLRLDKAPLVIAIVFIVVVIAGVGVYWLSRHRGNATEIPTIKRTAQITSWSGLDYYPAISPDGNIIAFSSDRTGSFEIYVQPLAAGAGEVQLTSDGGQNFEPAFSPNGDWIAYFSKKRGGIWMISITGGATKQLSEFGSHPSWSPDGSQIAFQSGSDQVIGFNDSNAQSPSTIWLVTKDGGEPRPLTQVGNPVGGHGAPSWSPDGKRIVFDTSDYGTYSVWSVSLQGDEPKLVSGKHNALDALYAPDGKSIYFIGDRGSTLQKVEVAAAGDPVGEPVKVFDASGSRIRQISISANGKRLVYAALSTAGDIWSTAISPTANPAAEHPLQLTQGKNTRYTTPAFSPDGKRIAYVVYTIGATFQVGVMDADGNNKKQLSDSGSHPCWFPDGNRIGFLSERSYWSVTVDGGKKKQLFDFAGDVGIARLSPDGKQVAFHSTRGGARNVWLMPIEGGEPRQLTSDKDASGFPAWSPDGRWIAFGIDHSDGQQVAIIPSGGGEPIQLTFDKGGSLLYGWLSDGEHILFARQRDDIWNIYSVSRSTRAIRQLTKFAKLNAYVRYPASSPAGDRIVYEYAETTGNIWLMELK